MFQPRVKNSSLPGKKTIVLLLFLQKKGKKTTGHLTNRFTHVHLSSSNSTTAKSLRVSLSVLSPCRIIQVTAAKNNTAALQGLKPRLFIRAAAEWETPPSRCSQLPAADKLALRVRSAHLAATLSFFSQRGLRCIYRPRLKTPPVKCNFPSFFSPFICLSHGTAQINMKGISLSTEAAPWTLSFDCRKQTTVKGGRGGKTSNLFSAGMAPDTV